MVAMSLRIVVVAVLAAWLVSIEVDEAAWSGDMFVTIGVCLAVAIAVVSEPRVAVRRAGLGVVVALFAAAVMFSHGWQLALLNLGEAALIALLVETRAWRWSVIPGLVLLCWFMLHLLPSGYGRGAPVDRMAWLFLALLMLVGNAARRAMQEDDADYRRFRSS